MDELIARLVANVGVDRAAAEKAVGIIFDFLRKEGPPDKVQALIDKLPGAQALIASAASRRRRRRHVRHGRHHGRRHQDDGGRPEHGPGAGRHREIIAYAREKAGEDAIGEIVGAIPGLSQFV